MFEIIFFQLFHITEYIIVKEIKNDKLIFCYSFSKFRKLFLPFDQLCLFKFRYRNTISRS